MIVLRGFHCIERQECLITDRYKMTMSKWKSEKCLFKELIINVPVFYLFHHLFQLLWYKY